MAQRRSIACEFCATSDSKNRNRYFGGSSLQFQKEVEILAPREKVWQFIWDVDRFIACVPGCKDAKTIEDGKRYTATMVEKVGPFKVEFPTTIEVLEREELTQIKAQASGADNKIGSRMKIDLDVQSARSRETKPLLVLSPGSTSWASSRPWAMASSSARRIRCSTSSPKP